MKIKTDKTFFDSYLSDASGFKGFADELYIPENETELQNLVSKLYSENIKFTISGAGTGLTGSRVPNGGVLISLEEFNKIESFDANIMQIISGVGIKWKELNDFLEEKGFFLPPNPTEFNSALGGNIACNSSGSRTFKYGSIRNFIEAITVILPNGDKIEIDRKNDNQLIKNSSLKFETQNSEIEIKTFPLNLPKTKNASGYYIKENMHLIDLFIGSEGTLGIITKAKIKFLKQPARLLGLIIYFEDDFSLLNFVFEIKNTLNKNAQLIDSRLIEYFDSNALNIIREKYSIPSEAKYAIWIEQEIDDDSKLEVITENWYYLICKFTKLGDLTWIATNHKDHKEMQEFRHFLPLQIYEHLAKINMVKIGTDTAVEDKDFKDYYFFIKRELSKIYLNHVVFGHIGNNHLHINLFGNNEIEKEIALKFYDKLMLHTISLKGTVSAEHGIGKLKKKYFKMMYNENEILGMQNIKLAFDPKNLLNTGNIFDIN